MPLTDSAIRALEPRNVKYKKSDGDGLYLFVQPSGTKTWKLRDRSGGRERFVTLGAYPDIGIRRARHIRDSRHLKEAEIVREAEGRAGLAERPSDTWEQVLTRYLAKRQREGAKPMTMKKLWLHAGATIRAFGEKRVAEASAQDVLRACRPYEAEGKMNSAHAVRILCSQVFRFAIAEGLCQFDPAAPTRDALTKPIDPGYRAVIKPKEVGLLMRDLHAYRGTPSVRVGLLLSAHIFLRNSELREARWADVDWKDQLLTIPGHRMKHKGNTPPPDHLVPLSRQVIALLRSIEFESGEQERILYSRYAGNGLVSENTFNQGLKRIGWLDRHVHHGFRKMASTNLNEMRWNADWIERQLGHVEMNKVRRAYNSAQYLDGRRRMMQAWSDWLEERASEARAEVA